MRAWIGVRTVTSATENIGTLAYTSRGQEDFGANCVPWALRPADQLQRQPVISVFHDIAQQSGRGVEFVNHYIDVAVVKQVPESSSSRWNHSRQPAARSRSDFLELRAIEVAEQLRPLRPRGSPVLFVDDRKNMAISDKQVKQAIIVKIQKACPPPEKRYRGLYQPRVIRDFGKDAVSFVTKQDVIVVREIRNIKVHFPIAVVIADRNAH